MITWPIRRVFFSCHYREPDITRAFVVRNHQIIKRHHGQSSSYVDKSLWEKTKTEGKASIKRLINRGLSGCSVTCVLIGNKTFERHWVQYEIFKSIADGKGVFGVHLNQINDFDGHNEALGPNPFEYLGYDISDTLSGELVPLVYSSPSWELYVDANRISAGNHRFRPFISSQLSAQLRVYDWVGDDGYNQFPAWIESAVQQAQR